jgi:diguanylate cyclase (GGDEF)-like protein/PAS domain S-box-containing protein
MKEVTEMEKELIAQEPFFKQIIEQSTDLIQSFSMDGTITYNCPAVSKLLGFSSEVLLGTPCFSWIHEQDAPLFQQALDRMALDLAPFVMEYRYRRQDGSYLWVQAKTSVIYAGNTPTGIGLIATDISDFKTTEASLTRMAYYDALTGLPNRRLFQDRYNQAFLSAKRYQHKLAVLYLDLDNFKQINDNYGHTVGDELLRTVATRLLNCVRDPDTVCRLGGDEFIILVQQFEHLEDIEKVVQRANDALNSRFIIHQHEISITCSIGTAVYSQNGVEDSDLVESADHAMYQAKRYGKN